jgi:hypothetical protein
VHDSGVEEEVDPSVVEAGAEKRFFIDMLTRDIELVPAIVDLVDNSVDGSRRLHAGGSLKTQWIRIEAGPESFSIEDNSGGIDVPVARDYAFRFGRPRAFAGVAKSVGQFGVGMKRAIFKLGNAFDIQSVYAGEDAKADPKIGSRFHLGVDVREWERDDSWTFRFDDFDEDVEIDGSEVAGTRIEVSKLHPSVADDLNDPVVIAELKRQIRVLHQGPIRRGLSIKVNGDELAATTPMLQSSNLIKPVRKEWDISVAGGGGPVHAVIYAGTVQPEQQAGGEEPDIGEAREFQDNGDAGWYVFCNDRLLLSAERTSLTGWGGPAAAYHPQYRTFRGYVYLEADDAAYLPWNTTKTAVDRDSPVWREVANEMKRALVDVQKAINAAKDARASYRRQAADAEQSGKRTPKLPDILIAMDETPAVELKKVAKSASMQVPAKPPRYRSSKPPANIKRIQYEVDLPLFDQVAEVLGATSGSEVGRLTFDYFVEAEVD